MIQEKYGQTVCKTLSSANPGQNPVCHRQDCKMCLSGPSGGKCYSNNIGYRISCNRKPCTNQIDNRKLSDKQVRNQLDKIQTNTSDKPAIYEGETFRSGYTRSKQHWQKYNAPKGKKSSFMWHHTANVHQGQIGNNKGQNDYKFAITNKFKDNLSRQTNEGKRQTVLESYQAANKVIALNSKIDFCQPVRTKLAVISKSTYILPGTT